MSDRFGAMLAEADRTGDYGPVLAATLEANPKAHGVLLSRHGLYTWGQSVAEARRHLEALEFLFQVEERRLQGLQPKTLADM